MEAVVDLILGSSENPIEMAVYLLVLIIVLDALFSTINALIGSVTKT